MTSAYIAKPLGLNKAGTSGLGGYTEPLLKIRRSDFQRLGGIRYALRWNVDIDAPTADTCLIDIVYDKLDPVQDPHASRPLTFITNYAGKQSPWWMGAFAAPNTSHACSAIGEHAVTIKVAPRASPVTGKHLEAITASDGTVTYEWVADSATQVLGARDFSEAAGGVIKTYTFEIVPDNTPYDLPPEQAAQDA